MIRFFRHYIPMSMLLLTVAEFMVFYFISGFVEARYSTASVLSPHPASVYKPW